MNSLTRGIVSVNPLLNKSIDKVINCVREKPYEILSSPDESKELVNRLKKLAQTQGADKTHLTRINGLIEMLDLF